MKGLRALSVATMLIMSSCFPGVMNNGGGEGNASDYALSDVATDPPGGLYGAFGGGPVQIRSKGRITAIWVHSPIQVTYEVGTLTWPENAPECDHDHHTTRWLSNGQSDTHFGFYCGYTAGDYKMILEGRACLFRNGDPCPIFNFASATQNFSVRG